MRPWPCVLALALAAGAGALCTGKPCCTECSTGDAYSNCACLEDNTPVVGHSVGPGAYRRYHYRLTDWSLTASEDRKIAFRLTPCHGSAHLLVNPAPNGFPTNGSTRWRSDRFGEVRPWLQHASPECSAEGPAYRCARRPRAPQENLVVVDLDYEQYFVSVFGATETNFTVEAITDGAGGSWPAGGAGAGLTLATGQPCAPPSPRLPQREHHGERKRDRVALDRGEAGPGRRHARDGRQLPARPRFSRRPVPRLPHGARQRGRRRRVRAWQLGSVAVRADDAVRRGEADDSLRRLVLRAPL